MTGERMEIKFQERSCCFLVKIENWQYSFHRGCMGQSFDLEHKCLEVVYCVIHTINIHLFVRKSSI